MSLYCIHHIIPPPPKLSLSIVHWLTFHDLLHLHLQGLDCPHWVLTSLPVHPMDGEFPFTHHCNVIILQVQHLVGVLDDGTVGREKTNMWGNRYGSNVKEEVSDINKVTIKKINDVVSCWIHHKTHTVDFSPGIRGKVILHRSSIPHSADAIGAVWTVIAVLFQDSLLEVSWRVKS